MPGPYLRRTEHPYLVNNLVDVPADLRPMLEKTLEPSEPVVAIFVIPPRLMPENIEGQGRMHWLPAQALLFAENRVVHVQAADSPNSSGWASWMRTDQVFYVRLVVVLLYGRLEIYGIKENAPVQIIVEYNTVAQESLQPVLHRFLSQVLSPDSQPSHRKTGASDALLEDLGQQSFKFRNGLQHYALLPGSDLLGFVFQPRLVHKIWGLIPRLVAPAALLALTPSELIVIEEGRTKASSYGWFITFIPRINVTKVESMPNTDHHTIRIQFSRAGVSAECSVTLEAAAAQSWMSLWRSQQTT